jgi:two-component system, LytTR family, sensor kinase
MKRPVLTFWLLQLGGWSALYLAQLGPFVGKDEFAYRAAERGVSMLIWLLLTTGLWRIYRQIFRRGVSSGIVLATSAVAAYCGAFLANGTWSVLHNAWVAPHFGAPLDTIHSVGYLFVSSVYNAPIVFAWSMLYFGIKYYQELGEERERSLRAQADAHEARLRALRYQLNPHFVFNTLNSVSTLVVEERNREAAGMIARLSDFLRIALEDPATPVVPLAEEIEFAKRYLDIEQIRFGGRLAVEFDVPDELLTAAVPVLILQPLIENAIKHAVSPREAGGSIRVTARRTDRTLVLQVMDDGPGLLALADPAAGGIGLANTRERIRQLYGAEQRLELSEAEGGGLRVCIEIPLHESVEPSAVAAAAR